jgi:hypothetical protein
MCVKVTTHRNLEPRSGICERIVAYTVFSTTASFVRFVDRASLNMHVMKPTWYTTYLQFIESLGHAVAQLVEELR